jgi:outer membrane lipoprotein-sorting protein
VEDPPILQRHPALRWLVPFGILCIAGVAAAGLFHATASSDSLPRTTPAALIGAVQDTQVTGYSGTVVSHLSIGLPDLPTVANAGEDMSFTSLLSGSHTLQVWYGGPGKQRIALLGATDETDLFHYGADMWQWSSADRVALHAVLPADAERRIGPAVSSASMTPAALGRTLLAALDPSTDVSVSEDHSVADRSAYELVLTPRTDSTKIGSVHIEVDGATKMPLGVQVYARGSSSAAIDVAFTSIHFGEQSDRNFTFQPPANASVREVKMPSRTEQRQHVHITGSGWTSVLSIKADPDDVEKFGKGLLHKATVPVAGSWGNGRLLDDELLSVLVTRDGRIYVGCVQPGDLYAAARTK